MTEFEVVGMMFNDLRLDSYNVICFGYDDLKGWINENMIDAYYINEIK